MVSAEKVTSRGLTDQGKRKRLRNLRLQTNALHLAEIVLTFVSLLFDEPILF